MKYIILPILLIFLSGCSKGIPSIRSAYPDEPKTVAVDVRPSEEIEAPTELFREPHPILDQLSLPEWVGIEIYAEVSNARSLEVVATNEQIVVFVGNRKEDKVYALVDEDSDGKVDEKIVIASGLNSPNGVAFASGDLYVAEISRILKFPNILDSLEDPSYEVFFDDLPDDASHGWKFIAFWPDGDLYIPIGAPCNNCDAWLPYSALHKLDLETKELSLVAQGIRNTVWFDRHPDTEELRFTDNGRDWFGNDIPPDELNVLSEKEEHFWYPFCHGGDLQDTEFTSRDCGEFTPPVTKLWPHVAALGMMFSDTIAVPSSWKNHILIAEHGSWNRTPAIGYRITAVDLETKQYKIFIDGRLQWSEVLWRPVDVASLPDGSMLISDDGAGLVYRVLFE